MIFYMYMSACFRRVYERREMGEWVTVCVVLVYTRATRSNMTHARASCLLFHLLWFSMLFCKLLLSHALWRNKNSCSQKSLFLYLLMSIKYGHWYTYMCERNILERLYFAAIWQHFEIAVFKCANKLLYFFVCSSWNKKKLFKSLRMPFGKYQTKFTQKYIVLLITVVKCLKVIFLYNTKKIII